MRVFFHKKFEKFIKQLKNQEVKQKIKSEVDLIINNPKKGKLLEHPFRKYTIYSVRLFYQSQEFRIAFTQKNKELVFLLIDQRENFYEKLIKQID